MRFIRVPLELAIPFLFLVLWAWTWPLWWNACEHRVDLSTTTTCIIRAPHGER